MPNWAYISSLGEYEVRLRNPDPPMARRQLLNQRPQLSTLSTRSDGRVYGTLQWNPVWAHDNCCQTGFATGLISFNATNGEQFWAFNWDDTLDTDTINFDLFFWDGPIVSPPSLSPDGELVMFTSPNSTLDGSILEWLLLIFNATTGEHLSTRVLANNDAHGKTSDFAPSIVNDPVEGYKVAIRTGYGSYVVLHVDGDGYNSSLYFETDNSDSEVWPEGTRGTTPLWSSDTSIVYLVKGYDPMPYCSYTGTFGCGDEFSCPPWRNWIEGIDVMTGNVIMTAGSGENQYNNPVLTYDYSGIVVTRVGQGWWTRNDCTTTGSGIGSPTADEFSYANHILATQLIRMQSSNGAETTVRDASDLASELDIMNEQAWFVPRTLSGSPIVVGPPTLIDGVSSEGVCFVMFIHETAIRVVALECSTFSVQWKTMPLGDVGAAGLCDPDNQHDCDWFKASGMLLIGDTLLVTVSFSRFGMFAIAADTGEILWSFAGAYALGSTMSRLPVAPLPPPASGFIVAPPRDFDQDSCSYFCNSTLLTLGCVYGGGINGEQCVNVCPGNEHLFFIPILEDHGPVDGFLADSLIDIQYSCVEALSTPALAPESGQSFPDGAQVSEQQDSPTKNAPMWLPSGGAQGRARAAWTTVDRMESPPLRWIFDPTTKAGAKPGVPAGINIDSIAVGKRTNSERESEHIYVATSMSEKEEGIVPVQIYCLNAKNGKVKWHKRLDRGKPAYPYTTQRHGVVSPIQLTQDSRQLIVGMGTVSNHPDDSQRHTEGWLFALDASNGDLLGSVGPLSSPVSQVKLAYGPSGLFIVAQVSIFSLRGGGKWELDPGGTVMVFDASLNQVWWRVFSAGGQWVVGCDGSHIFNTRAADSMDADRTTLMRLEALSVEDGSTIWTWEHEEKRAVTSPVIDCANGNGIITVACVNGHWHRIREDNGVEETAYGGESPPNYPISFLAPSVVLGGIRQPYRIIGGAIMGDYEPIAFDDSCDSDPGGANPCNEATYSFGAANFGDVNNVLQQEWQTNEPVSDQAFQWNSVVRDFPGSPPWVDTQDTVVYFESNSLVARSLSEGTAYWTLTGLFDNLRAMPNSLGSVPMPDNGLLVTVSGTSTSGRYSYGVPTALAYLGCPEGSSGELCATCLPGYYYFAGSCTPCPVLEGAMLFITIAAFLVVLILVILLGATPAAAPINVAINFFQIVAVLPSLNIRFHPYVFNVFQWMGLINLDLDMAAPECQWSEITWGHKFVVQATLPPLIQIILAIVYRRLKTKSPRMATLVIRGALWFAILGFLAVTRKCLQVFDCTQRLSGDSTLDAYPLILCYEGEWWVFVPFALFGLLFFSCGTLIITVWATRKVRRAAEGKAQVDEAFVRNYWLLFRRYKTSVNYFEVTILLRKGWIAFVSLMFSNFDGLVIATIITISAVSFLLGLWLRPFRYNADNFLEVILQLLLLGVTATAMISADEEYEDEDEARQATRDNVAIACVLMLGLAVLITTVAIVWRTCAVGQRYREKRNRRRQRKLSIEKGEIDEEEAVETIMDEVKEEPLPAPLRAPTDHVTMQSAFTSCGVPSEPTRVRRSSSIGIMLIIIFTVAVAITGELATKLMSHEPGEYRNQDCTNPGCDRETPASQSFLLSALILGSLLMCPPLAHLPAAICRRWTGSTGSVSGFKPMRLIAWAIQSAVFLSGPPLAVIMPENNGKIEKDEIDNFYETVTWWLIGCYAVSLYYIIDWLVTRVQMVKYFDLYTKTEEQVAFEAEEKKRKVTEARISRRKSKADEEARQMQVVYSGPTEPAFGSKLAPSSSSTPLAGTPSNAAAPVAAWEQEDDDDDRPPEYED